LAVLPKTKTGKIGEKTKNTERNSIKCEQKSTLRIPKGNELPRLVRLGTSARREQPREIKEGEKDWTTSSPQQ